MKVGQPETLRIRLLGGFRVSVGPRVVEEDRWGLKKAAGLVKLLALSPSHRLHRERVMDLLWPGFGAESAANNLHRTLYTARRVLEPRPPAAGRLYLRLRGDLLELSPEGYLRVDAAAFEEAAAAARRTRDPAAYRAAVDLYAGELLPGDRYEEWIDSRRQSLRRVYLSLLLGMAALHEERADYGSAIEALERVVSEEPSHEEARAGLTRLYSLNGRGKKATTPYNELRLDPAVDPDADARRPHLGISTDRSSPGPLPEGPETSDEHLHNLPAPRTSFVGRERERVEVKRELAMTRLLTLTGAGGCGKTRLALEVVRDLVGIYADGVWLVEFAPISNPALVPNAVAAVLGVRERPDLTLEKTIAKALQGRELLLVMDNCEHLIDACARIVDALLGDCERLRVLATSREALEVAGEVSWVVPSLAVPPETGQPPATRNPAHYESVQLFLERARSRLPTFGLTAENERAVAEVCRRLDGIPLAIELATARITTLAVDQIAERLGDSLDLLATRSRTAAPRQRTLRATLEWSHELLSKAEQTLFGRLSVFVDGWTLEAAEAVGTGVGVERDEVLDLLGRLVEKSLVVAGTGKDPGPRYRMLEPVRQYAWEKLGESEETEALRERHATYYLELVEAAEPELVGPGQVAWLDLLATEYANLRAALGWCLDKGGTDLERRAWMGLRLAAALGRFWSVHNPSEGRVWLEKGLARSEASLESLRAKALREAGLIAIYQLDPAAIAMLEDALTVSRKLEDELGEAVSVNYLMHAVGILRYHERLPTLRREIQALLEGPLKDRRSLAYLQLTSGMMAMITPDATPLARLEGALILFREVGDLRSCAQCLTITGIAALGQDDVDKAARAFDETLGLLWRLKDRIGTFYSLMGAAGVASRRGRPVRAARLSGAAEALRKAMGHPAQPLMRVGYDYDSYIAAARAELGERAFEAAFAEGMAMSPERAIEHALSPDAPATLAASPPDLPSPALTRREEEVAALVARGLTNRRIAAELSISERTVTTHVDHIMSKLGVTSRVQVAAWTVERRLH